VDRSALCFDAGLASGHLHCRVPRDPVHAIRYYIDAIEREIVIDRFLIVEKSAPYLRDKSTATCAGDTLELFPSEICS
jgi:hypothetical protein